MHVISIINFKTLKIFFILQFFSKEKNVILPYILHVIMIWEAGNEMSIDSNEGRRLSFPFGYSNTYPTNIKKISWSVIIKKLDYF